MYDSGVLFWQFLIVSSNI